jgi:polyvinyl alcohol dehydrogenase (cytochrome)
MTSGDVFAPAWQCELRRGRPDADFGTPPMLTTMSSGKDILVVGQKSGMTYGPT